VISDRPLARAGLKSERVLMADRGPGVFEQEVESIEDALGLTTVEKAVAWAQSGSMWPDTFGLACCAIEMMSIVSSRYDIARFGMERFSSSPRQADLLIVSGRVSHKMAGPLRQVYDQMLQLRRDVQQLHGAPGRRQDRPGRHPRAGLPAAAGGARGGRRPPPREDQGRRPARLHDPRCCAMTVSVGDGGCAVTAVAQ
jgi:hypothetical protein